MCPFLYFCYLSLPDFARHRCSRQVRLLCLHGYRQSAKTSREKLGSFRKTVAKQADLFFITAPHLIPNDEEDGSEEQYGWWFSQHNRTFDAHEKTGCDRGFADSLELIRETFEKEGPFDGIFAFSQGASLAAQLCVMQQLGKLDFSFK